jgi:hypothetical protein
MLLLALGPTLLHAQGPSQRQGMMRGGNRGMMGGMHGRPGMGGMGGGQGMMGGMGGGPGMMGGMGGGPGMMGGMGQGQGMMNGKPRNSRIDQNDPQALLALKDDLALTQKQVQSLEKMAKAGRKQAAQVLTKEQKKKLQELAGTADTARGRHGPMMKGPQGKPPKAPGRPMKKADPQPAADAQPAN